MVPYKPPKYRNYTFNCPLCGAYSSQDWPEMLYKDDEDEEMDVPHVAISRCLQCGKPSIWHKKKLIYPTTGSAPLPNEDLPADILTDYEEARSIASLSPRGASALLRLAIEKLCVHIGAKGNSLDKKIAYLVDQGLPQRVQRSLDAVRVIGNEAVHRGSLDLQADQKTVLALFDLVNIITDSTITRDRKIDDVYKVLPPEKLEAIDKRDNKKGIKK